MKPVYELGARSPGLRNRSSKYRTVPYLASYSGAFENILIEEKMSERAIGISKGMMGETGEEGVFGRKPGS